MSRVPQIIRTDGAWCLVQLVPDESMPTSTRTIILQTSADAQTVHTSFNRASSQGLHNCSVIWYPYPVIHAHVHAGAALGGFCHLN